MDKFKKYVETQFDRVKRSASQLVSEPDSSSSIDEEPSIELDPRVYELLRQKAERENTTIQALFHRAVQLLLEDKETEERIPVSAEQIQRNPLLSLDGLTAKKDLKPMMAPVAAAKGEEPDYDE
ncbi:hypothetical protein [Paenibacillus senegalensis]|uniref:hypothetical protein n=1 Tax=Paenibacillus senegalensis TaxID=1465766 RepID=UPI000288D6FD|nr:hypothetical protein [Paenibacillus senegalensis]